MQKSLRIPYSGLVSIRGGDDKSVDSTPIEVEAMRAAGPAGSSRVVAKFAGLATALRDFPALICEKADFAATAVIKDKADWAANREL